MNTHRHLGAALGALMIATIPSIALAQSPSSPSTAPSSPSPAPSVAASTAPDPGASPATAGIVREGWTLIAREDRPMSFQLPPGWVQTEGGADIFATGPLGEELLVFYRPPQDADFDAHVTRIERVEERNRRPRQEVATVLRSTGPGLVARLDRELDDGMLEAKFLFPSCPEYAMTLDITGPAPEATTDASPDAWDQIAATMNPCSPDPAPELVLAPEVTALAQAYLAAAAQTNADVGAIQAYLSKRRTVAQWRTKAAEMADALTRGMERVEALPWTPETRPLADAILAAYDASREVWGERVARVRGVPAIDRVLPAVNATGDAITAAGRQIRLALGLPTVPR